MMICRKALLRLFAIELALIVSLTGSALAQQANRIWITEVTIISPEQLDHIAKGSVLIEDGRIVSVVRGKITKRPARATVVSGKGLFLIPGLIDSHVHLAAVPVPPVENSPEIAKMVGQYYEQLPRSYLYFGYTTLVDLAVFNRSVLENFRQAPLHPDLYDCGPSLPLANGYPMAYAPPATRFQLYPNFIYDPERASSIPSEYKLQDHTPAAAVARVKSEGGICVKTYFERGFGQDNHLPVINADTLAEIRKSANQAGLVLMIHANSFEAQKFAAEGNVDVIAHGMWNWGDFTNRTDLPAEIKAVLDHILEKRVGYQPTIQVMGGFQAHFDLQYLKTEAIPKVVPAAMLELFNSPQGKSFKKELAGDNPPSDAVMFQAYEDGPIRRGRQVVAYLAARNANFLFGTDTPAAPSYGNLPGLNGYLEMQQLRKAGMSLQQIFRAATINNARMFKIDSQVGTIEPGKIANLVLLTKSPLETVEAYDSIVSVWVHGRQVSRETLASNASK
jgi:imidazolonepropionase-like amidohydrolase